MWQVSTLILTMLDFWNSEVPVIPLVVNNFLTSATKASSILQILKFLGCSVVLCLTAFILIPEEVLALVVQIRFCHLIVISEHKVVLGLVLNMWDTWRMIVILIFGRHVFVLSLFIRFFLFLVITVIWVCCTSVISWEQRGFGGVGWFSYKDCRGDLLH